jgi:hypothetical protein
MSLYFTCLKAFAFLSVIPEGNLLHPLLILPLSFRSDAEIAGREVKEIPAFCSFHRREQLPSGPELERYKEGLQPQMEDQAFIESFLIHQRLALPRRGP